MVWAKNLKSRVAGLLVAGLAGVVLFAPLSCAATVTERRLTELEQQMLAQQNRADRLDERLSALEWNRDQVGEAAAEAPATPAEAGQPVDRPELPVVRLEPPQSTAAPANRGGAVPNDASSPGTAPAPSSQTTSSAPPAPLPAAPPSPATPPASAGSENPRSR